MSQQLLQIGELKNHKEDEALEAISKAKKLEPDNIAIYTYIAALYNHKGLTYAALNELNEAQKKFGNKENILRFKRELLFKMKLYDRAIEEAEQLAQKENSFTGEFLKKVL